MRGYRGTPIQRFDRKVDRQSGAPCWLWTGARSGRYGSLRFRGAQWLAHRVAYTILVGEIPAGLTIDHRCENTRCVNPAHLEPVPMLENVRRGIPKGREANRRRRAARAHCRHGHAYTPENTYINPTTGARACRACSLASFHRNHHAGVAHG